MPSSAWASASPPTSTSTLAHACWRAGAGGRRGAAAAIADGAADRRNREIRAQRERVAELKSGCWRCKERDERAADLLSVVDHLVRRSIWIVGGDGWAYDIGYGGLDHVLAQGRDVNVLVLDTEVYSNTGGQASKATPLGAVAKFAAAGKRAARKDLALQAIAYGNVYVAQVAMGANPQQTLQAFREAEAYPGPSLILAYSHCIAHGIDMRRACSSRTSPSPAATGRCSASIRRCATVGENPFRLDSPRPTIPFKDYAYNEIRYRSLAATRPEEARALLAARTARSTRSTASTRTWPRATAAASSPKHGLRSLRQVGRPTEQRHESRHVISRASACAIR